MVPWRRINFYLFTCWIRAMIDDVWVPDPPTLASSEEVNSKCPQWKSIREQLNIAQHVMFDSLTTSL